MADDDTNDRDNVEDQTDGNDYVDKDVPHPGYAGRQTFMKAQRGHPSELTADVDIGVLGVPSDDTVSRYSDPGARHGPLALRQASSDYDYDGELFSIARDDFVSYRDLEVVDCGDVKIFPGDLDRTVDLISDHVQAIAETSVPITLGGDHYFTYPAYTGFARAVDGPVGVIQLDAHSDTLPSAPGHIDHFHASVMARIAGQDAGSYDTHAMIGLRGHEPPSFATARENHELLIRTATDVRQHGIEACAKDAIDHLSHSVDHIYLTVDIDCVSPAFAPGTGAPESGGLTDFELLRAMELFGDCAAIGALDMMEVAPDQTDATAQLGADAIVRFLERRFL